MAVNGSACTLTAQVLQQSRPLVQIARALKLTPLWVQVSSQMVPGTKWCSSLRRTVESRSTSSSWMERVSELWKASISMGLVQVQGGTVLSELEAKTLIAKTVIATRN